MKIHKGDNVVVLSGKDKGRRGEVVRAFPKEGRVIVEGVHRVKRHQRTTQVRKRAGIIEKDLAVPVSKVALVCPKEHGETIWDMKETDIAGLFQIASRVSKAVVAAVGADGFRFVQNNGEAANQVVAHVHVHVIPIKLEDREKFTGRKHFSPEEMQATAQAIRTEMGRS